MNRLLACLAAAGLLTGCWTLKPNDRKDGAVFMEIPLGEPPPARPPMAAQPR